LRLQGRYDDVLRVVDKTVQLGFDDARLWMLCGQTMVDLKRPYDALLSSQQVLKFEPPHWDAAGGRYLLPIDSAGRFCPNRVPPHKGGG